MFFFSSCYQKGVRKKRKAEIKAQKSVGKIMDRKIWIIWCIEQFTGRVKGENPLVYRNILRLNCTHFDDLLEMVHGMLKKDDTKVRITILVATKLEIRLRYLATGDSFKSLEYFFRIPESTISKILPEALTAISCAATIHWGQWNLIYYELTTVFFFCKNIFDESYSIYIVLQHTWSKSINRNLF